MVGQHPHRPGKHPGDGQQNLRVSLHLRLQRETVNDHNLTAGDCDGRGDSGEFVKERRFPKDIARFVDSQDFLTAILRVEKDHHTAGFQVIEPVGRGALQIDHSARRERDGGVMGFKGGPAVFGQAQFFDAEIPHRIPSFSD